MFNLSIESLYNIYHRETFKAQHGFYPKNVKNFNSIDDNKRELLTRFLEFCKHNYNDIDPRTYIKACAEFYKYPFKMNVLGSLSGNKIYKEYKTLHKNDVEKETDEDIINALKISLNTLNEWHKLHSNNAILDYFKEYVGLIPLFILDIIDGRMSTYFVSCLSMKTIERMFNEMDNEAFFELMKMQPNEFFTKNIKNKRVALYRSEQLRTIFDKIFTKFSSLSDK